MSFRGDCSAGQIAMSNFVNLNSIGNSHDACNNSLVYSRTDALESSSQLRSRSVRPAICVESSLFPPKPSTFRAALARRALR